MKWSYGTAIFPMVGKGKTKKQRRLEMSSFPDNVNLHLLTVLVPAATVRSTWGSKTILNFKNLFKLFTVFPLFCRQNMNCIPGHFVISTISISFQTIEERIGGIWTKEKTKSKSVMDGQRTVENLLTKRGNVELKLSWKHQI